MSARAGIDPRRYETMKFELAHVLRSISVQTPSDDDRHAAAQEALACLAEDRFNLVFVGRFSRGKTSLINALLGSDHLPTGLAPATSS